MVNKIKIILTIFALTSSMYAGNLFKFLGDQKKGTTTLGFLKIEPGALYSGLGGTGVSIGGNADAAYFNPALTTFIPADMSFSATYIRWVGDQNYTFAAFSKRFKKYSRIGVFLSGLYSGYIEKTDEYHPFGLGTYYTAGDFLVGANFSQNITDRFSFGANIKFAEENLASVKGQTVLFDFGTLYLVGYRDVQIGVSLSNIGPDFRFKGTYYNGMTQVQYEAYSVPVIYRIGFGGKIFDNLLSVMEIDKPSDDVEQFKLGFKYSPVDIFSINAGIRLNDAPPGSNYVTRGLNFGFSIKKSFGFRKHISFDYAVKTMGYLGYTHILTTGVNF